MMLRHRARWYLIELRPWPFGPPLRGRATLDEVPTNVAHQATAPVGGLALLLSIWV
jgi:hypothetical protein